MDPILIDLPMPIVTERLVIREPRVGEGAVINAAIVESYESLSRWLTWVHPMPTVEDSERFTREAAAKFTLRKDMHLRIWNPEQTRLHGGIGLMPKSWSPRVFEIGYWMRTSDAGKGLMTEAVVGLTEFAFKTLKADRIFIRCDVRNAASARVAEKSGYQLEGIMRNDCLDPTGELRSTMVFARIK
ncbi:GNAT family protein [soil metagenome]